MLVETLIGDQGAEEADLAPITMRAAIRGVIMRILAGTAVMPASGHRSSYHYRRSALPTFADYAVGMRDASNRVRDW
jgi:hypothetical protein